MCVCVCASSRKWWNIGRASVPSCWFPSAPTFLVSKFTQPKLYASELSQNTKNHHSIFNVGKDFVVSQRAFRCDDTKASFEVLSFPSTLIFTPSSCSLLFFLRMVGVVSPFQRFPSLLLLLLFFFQEGLSSDRSLFPGYVSVICGHYINSHGWPKEWAKGCDTHPDLANRLS